MAHECENCWQYCYCDIDDMGGMPQPRGCPHLLDPSACGAFYDDYERATDGPTEPEMRDERVRPS